MNYAQQQRNPGRQILIIAIVVLFQAALVYALMNGLGSAIVDVVKAPIETKIIQEHKQPPPPPPPPPPPQLANPPPPYIPPPDIQIQQPPPPKAIQQVTRTPPPVPPAPGPVRNAPPVAGPPDTSVSARPVSGPALEYPERMQDLGREGSVRVTCDVQADGRTTNCQISSVSGGSDFATAAMEYVTHARYRPAMHNGQPVPEPHHTFNITFKLGNDE
jgi:periplasmic protein TonB